MKTRYAIFFASAVLLLLAGCQRHYQIEDRALKQLPYSLPEYLEFQGFRSAKNIETSDIKLVYADDSICLYQFKADFSNGDTLATLDLRYIYQMDMMYSEIYHKPIFLEQFRQIPCMPGKLIRKCRRESKRAKESVYYQFLGSSEQVYYPFDEAQQ